MLKQVIMYDMNRIRSKLGKSDITYEEVMDFTYNDFMQIGIIDSDKPGVIIDAKKGKWRSAATLTDERGIKYDFNDVLPNTKFLIVSENKEWEEWGKVF